MPPSVAAGALASIKLVRGAHGDGLRARQQERAAKLKAMLAEAGIPVMPSETHIVPVPVGDPPAMQTCQRYLNGPLWDLRAADQLPNGPAWNRASAVHADAITQRRRYGSSGEVAARGMELA